MKVSRPAIGVLFVCVVLSGPTAQAGDLAVEVNALVGQKQLDADEWNPVEKQAAIGVEASWGPKSWPLRIATDLIYTTDDDTIEGVDLEGRTTELALGVRKTFEAGSNRPYLGAGLVFVNTEIEAGESDLRFSDDDSTTGYWLGGGVLFRLSYRFSLGLAARYSVADVTLAGIDGEGGGTAFGLVFGWRRPGT